MKKAKAARLTLHRETLRLLDQRQLNQVAGGTTLTNFSFCPADCHTNEEGCTQDVCI